MSPALTQAVSKLLTVNETAATLGISRRQVYRLFADGQLAWVSIGSHRRVAAADIDRFINAHTGHAEAATA